MLSSLLGIRLVLLMGERIPSPAPAEIMQAIQSVTVTDSLEDEQGFQLALRLDKNRQVDYPLLRHPLLRPFTRVVIAVVLGAKLEVLMDGILDYYDLTGGQENESTLTLFGKDLTTLMNLEQRNRSCGNEASSSIVQRILDGYTTEYGLTPEITTTQDQQSASERVFQQTETDLDTLQALARRHGFVFYIQPEAVGKNTAYWGPRDRPGIPPLPALTTNFGASDNVRSLQFSHNTRAPVRARVAIQEPSTGITIDIPIPTLEDLMGSSAQLTLPRRTDILRETAGETPERALLAGQATQTNAPNSVRVTGELDTVRYGHVLRAQRMVGVRGAGLSFDGNYRIDQVTHQIRPGQYTQSFSLSRRGLGANQPTVVL